MFSIKDRIAIFLFMLILCLCMSFVALVFAYFVFGICLGLNINFFSGTLKLFLCLVSTYGIVCFIDIIWMAIRLRTLSKKVMVPYFQIFIFFLHYPGSRYMFFELTPFSYRQQYQRFNEYKRASKINKK